MANVDELDVLFAPDYVTTLAERFKGALDTPFLDVFREGEPLMPPADSVSWDEIEHSRDLAPLVGPEAPSSSAVKVARIPRAGVLLDVAEHIDISAKRLAQWRAPGMSTASVEASLAVEIESLARKVLRTANTVAARALLSGGTAIDLSAIPNSKLKGSVTWPVHTLSATNSWALPATKIRSSEINLLKQEFTRKSGLFAKRAIGGPSVEGYITQNTEVSNTILGSQTIADKVAMSSFQDGGGVLNFGGLEWAWDDSVYAAAATPDTAATIKLDEDKVAILPGRDRARECFALAEGLVEVPTGNLFATAAGNGGALFDSRRGLQLWSVITGTDSGVPSIRVFARYRFLPIVKVAKAAMTFDPTP